MIDNSIEQELLECHKRDRQAHFATNVDAALADFNLPYLYIREGKIERLSRAEMESRYAEYFAGAIFQEWDDLEPPIIQVSPDSQWAWMATRLRVRYSRGQDSHTFIYAGITTFQKQDGQWKRVANASTFES